MSAPRNKTTSRRHVHHRISVIAVLPVAFAAATLATVEATASPWAPESTYQPAQVQTDGWPDEGTGYPGYGDQSSARSTGASRGLDTTSVALGALGGIALGGAGLGIALVVQRRRDHAALPTA